MWKSDGEEYGGGGDGEGIVEVLAEPMKKGVVGNVAKVMVKVTVERQWRSW